MLQHRLAKFYLSGFTRSSGARVLFEYEKSKGFCADVTPKRASAEVDIFEIEGADRHAAERFFSQVEGHAKKTFGALRIRRGPTQLEREFLSVFMALCFVRSSKREAETDAVFAGLEIEHIEQYFRRSDMKLKYMLDTPRTTAAQYDLEIQRYLDRLRRGELALPRPKRGSQLSLVENACTKWARCIEGMDWSVVVASGNDFFVVPDEPLVARRHGFPFDTGYVGISRGDLEVEITFPLNRRMCLVARHGQQTKRVAFGPATGALVDDINLRSVVCAHRLIFSPVRSASVEDLVRRVGAQGVMISPPSNFVYFLTGADEETPLS